MTNYNLEKNIKHEKKVFYLKIQNILNKKVFSKNFNLNNDNGCFLENLRSLIK